MTCPVNDDFDPLGPDYVHDPHQVMRPLREDTGIFYASKLERYVIPGYADIDQLLMHPEQFSSANTVKPVCPLSDEAADVLSHAFPRVPTLSNADGERHARMRRFVAAVLSPRRLKTLRPRLEQRADELVLSMLTRPVADFYAEIAFPLPAETAFQLLGFPPEDTAKIKSWVTDRQVMTWGRPTREKQLDIAHRILAFSDYIEEIIARREAEPADDAISELVDLHRQQPDALSIVDIANIVFLLSAGAHETTTALLVHSVRRLLENREQWEMLCADPALIPNAVEESLRYDASQYAWSRITSEDTTLGDAELPSGAELLVVLGSANHDEAVFPEAARFDIRRENARKHLSFGKGIHFCLGAPLARMQAEVVLKSLAAHAPSISLHPDQDFPYEENLATRSPKQLLLDVSPQKGQP
jgi:cytochrome P450